MPSSSSTSRSEWHLRNGKLLRPCIENVNTWSIVREDRRGAVALMHVEVDDQHAFDAVLGLHRARGDGGVVEHAEAFAEIAMRMVRAAGQVDAAAVTRARCGTRRSSRPPSAANARPSPATTESRCAAARRRRACRTTPRRRRRRRARARARRRSRRRLAQQADPPPPLRAPAAPRTCASGKRCPGGSGRTKWSV